MPSGTNLLPNRRTGEVEGLRQQPQSWTNVLTVQAQHDRLFHTDVMASSRAYQTRHCLMHLDKLLGALAAIVEKAFHKEDLGAHRTSFVSQRLPDFLVFAAKLSNLASVKGVAEPTVTGKAPTWTSEHEPKQLDWLERQLSAFEGSVARLNTLRQPLMDGPFTPTIAKAIAAEIPGLVVVAKGLASYYGHNIYDLYSARLLDVEHRKLL